MLWDAHCWCCTVSNVIGLTYPVVCQTTVLLLVLLTYPVVCQTTVLVLLTYPVVCQTSVSTVDLPCSVSD